MRRFLSFLSIVGIIFLLIGCDINFKNIKPIAINENIPTSVVIDSNKVLKISEGDTLQLTAKVNPEKAEQAVIWSSNNPDVATVGEQGLVTGHKAGTVTIRAAAAQKTEVYGSLYLTVLPRVIPATDASITGPTGIFINETIKYGYELTPADANIEVSWSSGNEQVFIVDDNGRVTGVGAGTAKLILQAGGVSAVLDVSVSARVVEPLAVAVIGRSDVEVNHTIPLLLVLNPKNAKDDAEWESSDPSVASVNDKGVVSGHKPGAVVITVRSLVNPALTANHDVRVFDYTVDASSLQTQLKDAYYKTKDSVLGVSNYKTDETTQLLKKKSIGSGSVYKTWFRLNDGSVVYDIDEIVTFDDVDVYCYYLMTNKHVVKDADAVKIYFYEEDTETEAVVAQVDQKVDLAVVYFEYDKYIRPLPLGDSSLIESTDFAIAIGNPSGYDFSATVTYGIISYPKRYLGEDTDNDGVNDWDGEYIQHQVPINPGNSGGPLLNLKGEIIGMNTLKFASTDIDNMGFSIPSNVIAVLLPFLEKGDILERATLGITVRDVRSYIESPEEGDPVFPEWLDYGIHIIGFAEKSAARDGGALIDDVILSFNGVEIRKTLQLRLELQNIISGSGREIEMEIYRNGVILTLILIF